ncbi:MAG: hypothetical protein PF481_00480 [Bacteroidales bacterium]|jgi:hypothetical protein|nr:hypothetical protein [Bacteroidales bacterium]
MKHFQYKIGVFLTLLIVINACQKEENIAESVTKSNESQFQEGMIQLGDKLDNPYTVENMRKAYQKIKDESQLKTSDISESNIEITHLYVRFLPKTDKEYAVLLNDTTLEIFDYPLDYEVKEGGTYYHDPELPDSVYTWKYCAVDKTYDFPNIEYELLAELFLPESMEDEASLKNFDTWSFWDDLEVEALKITGNYDESNETILKSSNGLRRKKWNPRGKIRMFDDSEGIDRFVPLRGVKVRAHSWFTTKFDLTNSKGEYYIDKKFKGHVNYSIKWERNDFELRSKRWGQAYYNGPRLKEKEWDLDISSGISRMYAIIHRAAHRYYYEDNAGLRRPPKRDHMLGRVTIGAFDWNYFDANADCGPIKRWTTFPEIRIFKPNRSCEHLYSTTIHELAHASHWDMGKHSDYNRADLIVCESWARGVQVAITELEYPGHSRTYSRLDYTGIVLDMLDGNKNTVSYYHSTYNAYSLKTYNDRVRGYTIRQIEDALIGQRTWNGWRDNIKNKYSNSTEDNLDDAFTYWNSK